MITQEQAVELAWAVVWSGGSSSNHTHVVQVLGAEGQRIAEHMTASLKERHRLMIEHLTFRNALEAIRDNKRFNNGVTAQDIAREALGE